MTNDEYIAKASDRRCFGEHDHIRWSNGRAMVCEKYLPRFVAALDQQFDILHTVLFERIHMQRANPEVSSAPDEVQVVELRGRA